MDVSLRERGVFVFGPFRLDAPRRSLWRGGQEVRLTARLFDTLLYLVQNPERLVTRNELQSAVWSGRMVEDGNLQKAVSALRKALQAEGGMDDIIVTVPGRGFQFALPVVFEPQTVDGARAGLIESSHGVEVAAATQPRQFLRGWAGFGLGAAVLAAAGGAWLFYELYEQPGSFAPPAHSVAVMAFNNLSGDPGQEYFSDGISEELIESLSHIRQVQVTARTSSFFFKGKEATIKEIAQALNVATVIEGSVRRQGNHMRVEARLTDARTGFQLWSHPFDSDLSDMLRLEADIAAQVADALRVKLSAGDAPDGSAGGTTSAQALDAYLKGVQNLRHDAMRSYRAALANFNAAIEADGSFALAYAGKANALVMIVNNQDASAPPAVIGTKTDVVRFSDAVSAARRAVELAPDLGAAHVALANVLDNGLDLRGAWAEADRALTLAPGDATVNLLFSFVALSVGHYEPAIQAARRAIELDPLREDGWLNLGQQYRVAGDYDAAFKAYQHAQTLAGGETPLIAYERALAYIAMGHPQSALDVSLRGSDWTHMECRAIAQQALGLQHDAERTFADLVKADDRFGFDYVYAEIFAQWRQPEQALHWLAKAKEASDSGLSIIKFDPMMAPIRQQPAFKAFEASLNFPN